jgi:peptidoglycan/xylan/chitin deacetylase (PgdA/CDA1 family)
VHRRDAVRAAAALTAGLALAGCGRSEPAETHRRAATPHPGPSHRATASPVDSTPTLSEDPRPLPGELVHGDRDRPRVALTFHGQGDPGLAAQLLGALEAGGARGTVLGVGSWLQQQPALVRRLLDAGHELGNHTQNHLDLTELDDDRALAEITDCARVLRDLTGSIGTWFRPSQIQYATPAIQAQARRAGYHTCLSYDVDSLDYTDPGAPAVVGTVLDAVRNGSIVSLHLGYPGTVAAIPGILAGLRERGLRPVTMTELTTP